MQEGSVGERKIIKTKIKDGLKVAREVYKDHRLKMYALQNKNLKKKLEKTQAVGESGAISVDGSFISDTDTIRSEIAGNASERIEDFPEIGEISQEKKKKMEELYGQKPQPSTSTTSNEMDLSEDNFIKPKKTAKPITQKTQQTSTTNKYGILQKEDISEENNVPRVQAPKKVWVPPIIINTPVNDYKKFIESIQKTLGHNNFSIKLNRNSSKLLTNSNEDRMKLLNDFEREGLECHTFTPTDQKTKKIVLKAAPGLNAEQLALTLREQNVTPTDVLPLRGKFQSHSYLITLPKTAKLDEVRKVDSLENLKVTWERYNRKSDYTQCHRCQAFGHGQRNCLNKPKCVKCPGFHYYRDCTLTRTNDSRAYCHNCGGDHSANYGKCPKLIEYLEFRNKMSTSNNAQTKQPKQIPASRTSPNRTYAQSARGINPEHSTQQPNLNVLTSLIGNDGDTQEILRLLNLIMNLKNDFKNCSTQLDKIAVIAKYLEKF